MLKRKIIGLFLLPLLLVTTVGSALLPATQVDAAVGQPGSIIIKLSPNRTDVTVTADREEAVGGGATYNSIKLKYNSGKQQWETGDIPLTNGGSSCAEFKYNMFRVTVRDNNGAALQTGGPYYAACGTQVNKPLTVPPATGGGTGSNGGIQGQLYLYDPNISKTALENPSSCTITMQSLTAGNPDGKVNKSYSNACGKDGKYVIPLSPGLPAGVYKFEAKGGYANPNGNNHVIDIVDTAAIEAGKMATLNVGEDFTDPSHPSTKILSDLQALTVVKPICPLGQTTCDTTPTAVHDTNPTCDTGGFGLNWILCPVYNGVADFCDWIFKQVVQPLLRTSPVSTNTSDTTYKIWSSFRVYGNIFLVIALLIIVFGQTIGGGVVDAYTAKKVLPRLLIAAILINLSLYIVAAAVDITNIVGGSLGALMTAPLENAGAFNISPSGVAAGTIVGTTGIVAAGTAIAVGVGAIPSLSFILLFLAMPALFGLLAAFITLILRKAIILALILVSPVAFALYCLPNTEQYFRKWWDFLFRTLLVYPIVIVIFAVADIMSVTVVKANNSANGLALVISFALQFLPLVFIPMAFRLAGGAIGKAHELLSGSQKRLQEGIKGNVNNPDSLRNKTKRNYGEKVTRAQARAVHAGDDDHGTSLRSRARRARGRASGVFGNVDGRLSNYNKLAAQRRDDLVGFGNDALVYAGGGYKLGAGEKAPGFLKGFGGEKAEDTSTQDRFFNSKGQQINKGLYDRGQRLYGQNVSDVGQSLGYNLTKSLGDDSRSNFRHSLSRAAISRDWNDDELNNAHAAAAYPNKGVNAAEWYSKPKIVKDASGRAAGVRFEDVNDSVKNYAAMQDDIHGTREAFKVSQDRDADMRAMLYNQQKLEAGFESGRVEDLDKDGNKIERDFDYDKDARSLAQTYETFDAISHKMRDSAGKTEVGDDGEVVSSSGTPAAQAVVQAAINTRSKAIKLEAPQADGSRTLTGTSRAATVYTGGHVSRNPYTNN